MDPVTGLSRRARRFLIALVVLGVVASTAATIGGAEAGCPDERWGCAASHQGEAVVLGVLVTEEGHALDALPATFRGRPFKTEVWPVPCSAGDGAEAARELGSDPLDAPPVFAVVLHACREAALPAAQILGDVGLPVIALEPPPLLPARSRTTLDGSSLEDLGAAAVLATRTAGEVAVERGTDVLIPRTPLLHALAEELPRVPLGNLAAGGGRT